MLNNAHANLINYIMSMLGLKPTLSKILLSKEKHPAGRTIKIENYFRNCDEQVYSSLDWESGAETDEASEFLEDDQDDGTLRDGMKEKLKFSMKQIKAYHVLGCLVESGRQEYYDSENEVHEEKLLSLWNLLNPNEKLSARKSKQWEDIGFQGLDPATDFRGAGVLGLDQMIYFAKHDLENCRRILQLSLHPIKGFPFAICSITITFIGKELLAEGYLKRHVYNSINPEEVSIEDFHRIYLALFKLFAEHWFSSDENRDIMNFNIVKSEFISRIKSYLSLDCSNLNDQIKMENINSLI
uniref:ELMO domain-containing protein n=1 Tax=Rhabditophanes sp. KR3021 TaxID=114890 RepID=A0AC35TMC5_9BILA